MTNWNELIDTLADKEGIDITVDPTKWNLDNQDYLTIYKQWQDANFNMSAIKWTNYYPGMHFNNSIIEETISMLGVKLHRSWISKIDPGYFAPWHWDIDDYEHEYLKKGKIKRFSIFLSNPHPGHFFTTDDKVFSNTVQGTVYQWKDHRSWHAGANAGLSSKFMLHLVAY